jgi:hypothetical protein
MAFQTMCSDRHLCEHCYHVVCNNPVGYAFGRQVGAVFSTSMLVLASRSYLP